MDRGKSEHCDKIKEETLGMTARNAAKYFCTDSKTAKEVFEFEPDHDNSTTPFPVSHAKLCKEWNPSLYTPQTPEVGLWKGEYQKMKMPKDIPHVSYTGYYKEYISY